MAVSSNDSASRSEPSAARTTAGSAAASKAICSRRRMSSSVVVSRSGAMGRKSKRCTRESTVAGMSRGSVVASTKTTWAGGSSSVFSSALNAASVSWWTSSMMYTLKRPRAGAYLTFSRSVRISSMPRLEAPSISITSIERLASRHTEHAPHASAPVRSGQSSAFASSRAVVVLPTPRGPANR